MQESPFDKFPRSRVTIPGISSNGDFPVGMVELRDTFALLPGPITAKQPSPKFLARIRNTSKQYLWEIAKWKYIKNSNRISNSNRDCCRNFLQTHTNLYSSNHLILYSFLEWRLWKSNEKQIIIIF